MSEKLAVVMPARNETESFGNGFIQEVLNNIPEDHEPLVVVAVNNSTPEFIDVAAEVGRNVPNVKIVQMGSLAPRTFAYAYLDGFRAALNEGVDKIVEMDATGAHNPRYIQDFSDSLDFHDAAFSSRFSPGSGIDRYPLQRKAISYIGTKVANMTLGISGNYPDLTSGYEAFRSEVLKEMFNIEPPEDWVSVTRGPGHLVQVEARVKTIWMDNEIGIVPIVWGTNRAKPPNTLPIKTVAEAAANLYYLRAKRPMYANRI